MKYTSCSSCALFALLAIVGAVGAGSASGSRSWSATAAATPGQEITVPPFGVHLTVESPPSDVIPQSAAVQAALNHSFGITADGKLPSGVQVTADYGLFSDDTMTAVPDNGTAELLYQKLRAWLVTFTGRGIGVPNLGPPASVTPPAGTTTGSTDGIDSESVVIDAHTGDFIELID